MASLIYYNNKLFKRRLKVGNFIEDITTLYMSANFVSDCSCDHDVAHNSTRLVSTLLALESPVLAVLTAVT